jgi:DNA-binding NarL/FixJ family response regulator
MIERTEQAPLRALVVFEDYLLRDLVQFFLSNHSGIQVVGTCHVDGFSLVTLETLRPDVIVADLMSPETTLALLKVLAEHSERVRLVSVSLSRDEIFSVEIQGKRSADVDEFVRTVQGDHQNRSESNPDLRRQSIALQRG